MKGTISGTDWVDITGASKWSGTAPRRTRWAGPLGWCWLALLVVSLAAGGCGGCGKKKGPAPRPTAAGPSPGPQRPSPGPAPHAKGPAGKGAEPGMDPEAKPPMAKPAKPSPEEEKPEPSRPDDVSQWKRDDYFSAKEDNDPKLVEALEHFGQRFVGNAEAAQMLAELLPVVEEEPEPKPEEEPGTKPRAKPGTKPGPGRPPGPPEGMMPGMSEGRYRPGWRTREAMKPKTLVLHPEAIQAAVAALAVNGTSDAHKTLEALLAGKIDTGDDQAATEAVLGELAAHPSPENEEILFRALTAPETYRPKEATAKEPEEKSPMPGPPGLRPMPGYSRSGRQDVTTAAAIQKMALGFAEQAASSRLRERLARHLVDRSTPLEQVELLGPFLREAHPDNLRAQLILYQAVDVKKETQKSILQYFTNYSSQALGLMLGVSTGEQTNRSRRRPSYGMEGSMMEMPGMQPSRRRGPTRPRPGQPAVEADPDLPYRLAGQIWGPEFAAFIDGSLQKVDSLDEHPQLVLLAATIPTDAMRFKLHELLKQRWVDGTAGLESVGFPDQVVTDPGLLITVKSLPRARVGKPTSGTGHRTGTRPARRETPGADSPQREKEDREQAEQDWLRVSADMVTVLCGRFQDATLAEVEAARQQRRKPNFAPALEGLPVEIQGDPVRGDPDQGDPELLSAYRLEFPGPLQSKVPSVPLGQMKIYYVRLKTKERVSTVVGYYKRQLRSRRAYESAQGTWLDSCREDDTGNRQRSVDVMISNATATGTRQPGRQPGSEQPGRTSTAEPEDLIIEILTIEMLDPSRKPAAPAPKPQTPKKG